MRQYLYYKKVAFCFVVVLFGLKKQGNGQVYSIGKIISYKKIAGGIEGKTATAIFDVHAYNDNIIRIRVSKEETFHNFSYSLIENNIPSFNVAITENGHTIFISTNSINVEIEKQPSFRVTFKNKHGEIINEDVEGNGFGTTFIGDKVSIYKKLQEGERFVGMGESLG